MPLAEDRPFQPASARTMARFFAEHPSLPEPVLAADPNGLLMAEWASKERGVLAMVFLPSGRVRFAAVAPADHPEPRARISSELPRAQVVAAVQDYLPSTEAASAADVSDGRRSVGAAGGASERQMLPDVADLNTMSRRFKPQVDS